MCNYAKLEGELNLLAEKVLKGKATKSEVTTLVEEFVKSQGIALDVPQPKPCSVNVLYAAIGRLIVAVRRIAAGQPSCYNLPAVAGKILASAWVLDRNRAA